jgi:predicted N-acyltransferase
MKHCLLKTTCKTELDISVYKSVNDIQINHWNKVTGQKNIYLSLDYLDAIEKSLNNEITFRYLLFYNAAHTPVAVAAVQFLPFFNKEINALDPLCLVKDKLKKRLLSSSGVEIMTCGSPFSCGENGFMFTNDISENEAYENLTEGLIKLQKLEKRNQKAPVLLIKEFWPESHSAFRSLKSSGFKDFMIDVNMVMKIDTTWKNFDDYLFAMVTKFRTKAKSAFKKSIDIQVRDLQVKDIVENKKSIENLYYSVVERSHFTFGKLNGESFVNLKKNLGNRFIIKGYFFNRELVGFSSVLIYNNIADACYVGINYDLNQQHAIYQRMLYDYVALAINERCTELRFGRTAEEIKSTIGALPVNMKLFIRHQNKIKNSLLKPVFGSMIPSPFELRNPFKAVYRMGLN